MQRKFIDYITLDQNSNLPAIIEVSKLLGYSQIWVSRRWDSKPFYIDNFQNNESLELINRLDIDSSNTSKEKIIQILRRERRNYPIISIRCIDSEIVGWAAQDNRIDIITFPLNQIGKLFTRSIAKLMIKFVKHLEISLSELYLTPERIQIPMFRQIRQALEVASLKSVPVIINSGASTQNQLRTPRELISLFQVLRSEKETTLDPISIIPSQLLSRNQIKISNNYIAPGIYLTNENEDILEEEE